MTDLIQVPTAMSSLHFLSYVNRRIVCTMKKELIILMLKISVKACRIIWNGFKAQWIINIS